MITTTKPSTVEDFSRFKWTFYVPIPKSPVRVGENHRLYYDDVIDTDRVWTEISPEMATFITHHVILDFNLLRFHNPPQYGRACWILLADKFPRDVQLTMAERGIYAVGFV
jgi:hypothetical protein